MNRALQLVASEPWAISEQWLRNIVAVANRNDLAAITQAVAAKSGERLEGTSGVVIRDGVAVLTASGPIFPVSTLLTEFISLVFGATTLDRFATDFTAAVENPKVKAVLVRFDSPGGMISAVNEMADMMFAARDRKPIVAYAGGLMASAAYWFGSAAHAIVAEKTAQLGSIGAVITVDGSEDPDEFVFVSSQSPNKWASPDTESGKSQYQALVDSLAGVFINSVSRNRGVDADTVLTNFGGGSLRVGEDAVTSGLADRLGSFETVLAELASGKFMEATMAAKQQKIALAEEDEEKDEESKSKAEEDKEKDEESKAEEDEEEKDESAEEDDDEDDEMAMLAKSNPGLAARFRDTAKALKAIERRLESAERDKAVAEVARVIDQARADFRLNQAEAAVWSRRLVAAKVSGDSAQESDLMAMLKQKSPHATPGKFGASARVSEPTVTGMFVVDNDEAAQAIHAVEARGIKRGSKKFSDAYQSELAKIRRGA
ncbi:MAG TPA: S49 family peptidase [Rhodothermales bacterium]|nr:S49 family peptidase [Rhodothermales bacterium]